MRISWYYSIGLLILAVLVHFVANTFGVYDLQIQAGFVWIDNLIHALVGAAVALMGLRWVSVGYPSVGRGSAVLFVTLFVFVVALGWEMLEFVYWKLFPVSALELKIYSPSILEAGMDVLSNVIGGVVCEMVFLGANFWKQNK